jgi:hypothetical protein
MVNAATTAASNRFPASLHRSGAELRRVIPITCDCDAAD